MPIFLVFIDSITDWDNFQPTDELLQVTTKFLLKNL